MTLDQLYTLYRAGFTEIESDDSYIMDCAGPSTCAQCEFSIMGHCASPDWTNDRVSQEELNQLQSIHPELCL